jgi:hypothetical protein
MKTTLGLTIAWLISGVAAVAADVAGNWKVDGSIGQFPVEVSDLVTLIGAFRL